MSELLSHPLWNRALLVLYAASALATAVHALLNKRDPRSAWGWISVCWLFPLAGAVLYLLFGINRVQTRAQRLVGATELPAPATRSLPAAVHALRLSAIDAVELSELVRIGDAVTGRPLVGGNRIVPLHNGEQAYPAMLEAIDRARHTVDFATYLFRPGQAGERFAEALAAAQRRGVTVRVLLDGAADFFYRPRASRLLARHGVRAELFLPLRWFPPMLHINLRNHRKLLLVDGRVAFTGGMNIADWHYVERPQRRPVADLHFALEGPVVAQIAEAFAADWQFATGDRPPPSPDPPAVSDGVAARVITDGPNEDLDKLQMVLLGAIASAHRRVWIMTPYFIPSPQLVAALQSAALRGVDVSLVLPAKSDQFWVDAASRNHLPALLQRAVRVYYRPAPFAHTKLFVMDHYYAQLGSANLDNRSLRLNFELVVETFDTALVEKLARHFEQVRAISRELSYAELAARPPAARLRDAFFWLFSQYL
ncbi:MAG: phospholipase D-like domain-containing protein [Sinobacteraceae bacterium]|nr:phospholipase D-like domain-containing protein [Nevskiaceae bacterium]